MQPNKKWFEDCGWYKERSSSDGGWLHPWQCQVHDDDDDEDLDDDDGDDDDDDDDDGDDDKDEDGDSEDEDDENDIDCQPVNVKVGSTGKYKTTVIAPVQMLIYDL